MRRYRARRKGMTIGVERRAGFVYLIQCVGFPYYKIGISEGKAKVRLKALQTGVPFKLKLVKSVFVSSTVDTEGYLHSLYQAKRVRGEWFNFTDGELCEVVKKYEHLSLLYRMIA